MTFIEVVNPIQVEDTTKTAFKAAATANTINHVRTPGQSWRNSDASTGTIAASAKP